MSAQKVTTTTNDVAAKTAAATTAATKPATTKPAATKPAVAKPAAAATRKRPLQRNFLKVFDQMCKCMRLDYIDNSLFMVSDYGKYEGTLEKLNPSMFQSRLICDRDLTQILLEYLCWYNDPAIRLQIGAGSAWQPFVPGYSVERYGDALYVTDVTAEKRLCTGDRIVTMNRSSLDEIHEQVERTLFSPSDPAREDWTIALSYAKHLGVAHADGTQEELEVERYDLPPVAAKVPSLRLLTQHDIDICGCGAGAGAGQRLPQGKVGLLDLGTPGMMDPAPHVAALADELSDLDALIIDARGVRGGTLESLFCLLPWILDHEVSYRDVFGDPGLIMNWSRRNALAKADELKAIRNQDGEEAEGGAGEGATERRAVIDDLIAEIDAKRGKGIIEEEEHGFDDVTFAPRQKAPARVAILSDRHTGEAAEMLVRAAGASGKATVVGRATLGSLDNTCLRAVELDQDFTLIFPMGKYMAAKGDGATRTHGIAPDVNVPWTPEFLLTDVDLQEAVKALH